MRMGLREANQRFSKAVKAVKAVKGGEEVVLTERGKPIAVIRPVKEPTCTEVALRRLVAAGLLRPAVRRTPMPRLRPRRIKGPPLSQTLREERNAL